MAQNSLCVIETYGVRVSIEDFCGMRFLLDFIELYRNKLYNSAERLSRYGTPNVVVRQQEDNLVTVAAIIKDSEGKCFSSRRTSVLAVPAMPKLTAREVWKAISQVFPSVVHRPAPVFDLGARQVVELDPVEVPAVPQPGEVPVEEVPVVLQPGEVLLEEDPGLAQPVELPVVTAEDWFARHPVEGVRVSIRIGLDRYKQSRNHDELYESTKDFLRLTTEDERISAWLVTKEIHRLCEEPNNMDVFEAAKQVLIDRKVVRDY